MEPLVRGDVGSRYISLRVFGVWLPTNPSSISAPPGA